MTSRDNSEAVPSVPSSLLLAVTAIFALAAPTSRATAGAWARAPGEAYVKASLSRLEAVEMIDARGSTGPLFDPALYENTRYSEVGAALYAEYGLFPALTVAAALPFKITDQEAEGRFGAGGIEVATYGLGDFHIGLRVPLHRGALALALEPNLKVPLYEIQETATSAPELGSGFLDLGVALAVGAGVPSVRGYGQGSFGYRVRGGGLAGETYWDFEVGFEPMRALRARFRYDGVDSRGGEMPSATPMEMGALVPNSGEQDFQRVAPTLGLALDQLSEISLTWRKVVDGRNTILSSEWEIAFSFLGEFLPAKSAGP